MSYKEEMSKIGYNSEELYFEKINRELIHKIKVEKPISDQENTGGQILQFRSKAVKEEAPKLKKAA